MAPLPELPVYVDPSEARQQDGEHRREAEVWATHRGRTDRPKGNLKGNPPNVPVPHDALRWQDV